MNPNPPISHITGPNYSLPFIPTIPHLPGPTIPNSNVNQSVIISAAAPVETGQPNCTLYIQNLPEKPNPLRHLPAILTDLFSAFGPLRRPPMLRKGLALHGQAWIIFENQSDAVKALHSLQGQRIWGKSMVIRFARFRSDCVVNPDELEAERKIRVMDRLERAKNPRITRRQLLTQVMSTNPSAMQSMSLSGPDVLLPNRILFIQNIPQILPNVNQQLNDIFSRYPGFQDLRMIPNRPDVAFVEYENEAQAGAVRQIVDRTEILPGHFLRVSFARR